MLGYSHIPEYWKKNLYEVEDRDFAYTNLSLHDVYNLGLKQAFQVVLKNGGEVNDSLVTIACQNPVPVRLEQSFEGHFPVDRKPLNLQLTKEIANVTFNGIGAVIRGYTRCSDEDYVAKIAVSIDGNEVETILLPVASSPARRVDIFWKYQLPKTNHAIAFKWLNPQKDASVNMGDALIYSDKLIQ